MKILLLDRPANREIFKSREVEFFGPWAQPIDSPEDLTRPVFEPYPTAESVRDTSIKVIKAAADILQSLAISLPRLTGVDKGRRFWEVFLGYHVIVLATLVEDIKIRHLSLPEKKYILGLTARNCLLQKYIVYSWEESLFHLYHDNYFRQYAMGLYLKNYFKNHEFIEYQSCLPKDITNRPREFYYRFMHGSLRRKLKKLSTVLFGSKYAPGESPSYNSSSSLVWDVYNLEKSDFKGMNVAFFPEFYFPIFKFLPRFRADREKRSKIIDILPFPYGELLALSLPLISLEGLPYMINLIKNEKINRFRNITRIYTHGQAFADEGFKRLFFAMLANEGKSIVSIQHGGGELLYLAQAGGFIERMLADEHISWGNGYGDPDGFPLLNKTKSLSNIYLSKIKQKVSSGGKKEKWKILFIVFEENKYVRWLNSPLFPDMAHDYFAREKVLLDYFCNTGKKVAVKVYFETYGWYQADWIKIKYPGAELLTSGRFIDYAMKSELVILDYNSTAFLEMLAINKPFLATWNRKWFRGNNLFEDGINKLADAGVFYDKPFNLIDNYKKIVILDIDVWWHDEKRQAAVREMANNFAMTSENNYEEWVKEFKRA